MFDIKAPTGWFVDCTVDPKLCDYTDGSSSRVPTTFSVRDEDKHKAIKRPVASAYSMSSLKELEPMNDDCSAIFSRKLEGFAGQEIDLGQWLHVRIHRSRLNVDRKLTLCSGMPRMSSAP